MRSAKRSSHAGGEAGTLQRLDSDIERYGKIVSKDTENKRPKIGKTQSGTMYIGVRKCGACNLATWNGWGTQPQLCIDCDY